MCPAEIVDLKLAFTAFGVQLFGAWLGYASVVLCFQLF